jgi:hypothetical protein
MANGIVEQLATVILAAGGLGVAAYGVVDGAKVIPGIGLIGYRHLRNQLEPLMAAIGRAYGSDTEPLLKAQYRGGRAQGELPRSLRQGYRIGLPALEPTEIRAVAEAIGVAQSEAILGAAAKLRAGTTPEPAEREALSRLEVAADARIEAAMALAESDYVSGTKLLAGGLAIAIAVIVGWLVKDEILGHWLMKSVLIGLIAVPVAPVAKDLSTAVSEAARALRGR